MGVPVERSIRLATTVVVPRSNAIPKRRSVVSPGSTPTSSSSTTTAVTLKSGPQGPPEAADHVRINAQFQVVDRVKEAREFGPLVGQRWLDHLDVALLRPPVAG